MSLRAASLYLPLATETSTRLLDLLPGPDDSAINIELHEVDLNHSPDYEAVSYTWGSEGSEQTVYVNEKPCDIRYNLYRFLFRLRQQSPRRRTLWVDAISISQIDLDEKRQQVAVIGKIFSSAKRVLIWLGEHADGSEYLFRPGLPLATLTSSSLSYKFRPSSEEKRQIRAVQWGALLDRSYWRRIWVVQEIALAKCITVHCGDDWQDWDQLTEHDIDFDGKDYYFAGIDVFKEPSSETANSGSYREVYLRTDVQDLYSLHDRMSSHRERRRTLTHKAKGCLAHTLLGWSDPHQECSDRRDLVYALLSLHTKQTSVQPDYQIGMSELFLRVYKDLIEFEARNAPSTYEVSAELSSNVVYVMTYLGLTDAELRRTLQSVLTMGRRTNLVSSYTWMAPVLYGVIWNLRKTNAAELDTTAASDDLLKKLRKPPDPDADAAFDEVKHEAILLLEAMSAW